MRFCAAAAIAVFSGTIAWAQTDNPVVIPPAPPIVSAPLSSPPPVTPALPAPPPGLVQTPVPPAGSPASTSSATVPAAAVPGTAPPAAPPDAAAAVPNTWLPGKTATIGVLDKVDGSISQISVPVGGQTNVGDLQLSVQACATRPPDQIPDVTIFLSVQNTADGSTTPLFRGWMVRSTPGATVVGDAGETFRVVGCA